MRGHIRKRSKDSWTVVVELPRDPETGKRRQKWKTVRGTKKEAERVLAELITQVEGGTIGTASARLTVGRYLDQWLEAVGGELKPSTLRTYRNEIKQLKQVIGDIPLAKLTALDVQRALAGFLHLSPRTRRNHFSLLRAALRQAVKWGLIPKAATDGVKVSQNTGREMRVWTEEEVARFLEVAKRSRHYALFHLALAAGMRLGELLGLKWEDVDLEAGVIYVRRNLANVPKEKILQDPKTASARRRIPIDEETLEVLKKHRFRQLRERLRAGDRWEDHGLVFPTREGRPGCPIAVWESFKTWVRRAGVPNIRFHDLRHTHATLLLREGVHPKIVAERLGHSSVGITLNTYSHVLADTQEIAVRAIRRVLRRRHANSLAKVCKPQKRNPKIQ